MSRLRCRRRKVNPIRGGVVIRVDGGSRQRMSGSHVGGCRVKDGYVCSPAQRINHRFTSIDQIQSIAYFDLNELFDRRSTDVVFPSLKISFPFSWKRQQFIPYADASYICPTRERSKNDGLWLRAGVQHKVTLLGVPVNSVAWMLHDSGVFQGDAGWMGNVTTSCQIPILWKINLVPATRYSLPLTMNDARRNQLVLSVGAQRTF